MSSPGVVKIGAESGPLPAYLASPDGDGPWPGVVVLHDVLGMTHDLRHQADWLASAGFLAVAPDLYRADRKPGCIVRVMRDAQRRRGRTFDDIEAARTWLIERPECTGRVAVIGFCMGGGFALLLAPTGAFAVAGVNYGTAGGQAYSEAFLRGTCPIVASYGAKDRANRGSGDRLAGVLATLGVDHDVKTYPDAGHSFLNDHDPADVPALFAVLGHLSPAPFHEPSAVDARRRILAFFDRHLAS